MEYWSCVKRDFLVNEKKRENSRRANGAGRENNLNVYFFGNARKSSLALRVLAFQGVEPDFFLADKFYFISHPDHPKNLRSIFTS